MSDVVLIRRLKGILHRLPCGGSGIIVRSEPIPVRPRIRGRLANRIARHPKVVDAPNKEEILLKAREFLGQRSFRNIQRRQDRRRRSEALAIMMDHPMAEAGTLPELIDDAIKTTPGSVIVQTLDPSLEESRRSNR